MRLLSVLCLTGITLLTGCYTLPQQHDYFATNPFLAPPTIQPINTQPNFTPFQGYGATSNEGQYHTVYVSTPTGLVQKRCKVLAGQYVNCI